MDGPVLLQPERAARSARRSGPDHVCAAVRVDAEVPGRYLEITATRDLDELASGNIDALRGDRDPADNRVLSVFKRCRPGCQQSDLLRILLDFRLQRVAFQAVQLFLPFPAVPDPLRTICLEMIDSFLFLIRY